MSLLFRSRILVGALLGSRLLHSVAAIHYRRSKNKSEVSEHCKSVLSSQGGYDSYDKTLTRFLCVILSMASGYSSCGANEYLLPHGESGGEKRRPGSCE